jgi:outer membrane protein assembly factor BamB
MWSINDYTVTIYRMVTTPRGRRFSMPVNSTSVCRSLLVCLLLLAISPVAGLSEDWPKYHRDIFNTGNSAEPGIDSHNVGTLKQKWVFMASGPISASTAVATVGGVSTVFIGDWNGTFYALNALTGAQIWSFSIAPCTPYCRIASSPAVVRGVVYFGAADATLYALNAATGHLIRKSKLADPTAGYEIWSSPAVDSAGTLYIGLASHGDHPCVIGHVVAVNTSNGSVKWDFTTIDQSTCPPSLPPALCVGAGVWSSPAIDEVNGIVYVGTGNPGSTCTPKTKNAAKWPDSILALRASDGVLLNYFQALSNDTNDLDFGASPVLYSASVSSACDAASTLPTWVSEPSKDKMLYTLERGASGLIGAPIVTTLDSVTVATPAVTTDQGAALCKAPLVVPTIASLYSASEGGLLKSIDPQDGTVTWTVPIGAGFSAPAIIEDMVFVGSADKTTPGLRGVTRSGSAAFTFKTGGAVYSGPAISNGRIYFGSMDSNVYALSPNGQ